MRARSSPEYSWIDSPLFWADSTSLLTSAGDNARRGCRMSTSLLSRSTLTMGFDGRRRDFTNQLQNVLSA